ncbi:LPXTG-motif cell wall-anchored protein [Streptomyces canus]|uniref:LPXTG-motif cell wall-anchored protein n=1 Tax=Streptomyces canus TaxID=58343 RepID=A0AAW8FD18_9ACTN|nr:LPXTG-motif cell wall-anchored protein [Streptomyces canus]MDQ0908031.1 LPXTG-motif cell wall-anchored protein [Streptomyces canus]MDQ1067997.1 LPXTG-motif cell wall-anchored protein [Streptomyces canus]
MSSVRRPLLTATAAGTLLGALWFVPSANATQDSPARTEPSPQVTAQARVTTTSAETSVDDTRLADTGSFDTTPYVVGGTLFLTLGAGFVVYSVRRERLGF